MIWIYPEQLSTTLQKALTRVYVLFGNDFCILKDSQLSIIQAAKISNFCEHISVDVDVYYNWDKIFNLCKIPNLFKQRTILSLKFAQDYPVTYFNKNISLLASCLYSDTLLILYIYTPRYLKKKNIYHQFFQEMGTFVLCMKPEDIQLTTWVMRQAKNMQLSIEKLACQLLCYYYKDNLILLQQILHIVSLIYSDKYLSFIRVKKIVTDSVYFDIHHWIEAILIGNKKRADRILRQLEYMEVNWEILLNKTQHEIFILINIKHTLTSKNSLHYLFKQYKVYEQYRCMLLQHAIQRLRLYQLYRSLALLVQIELRYKKEYGYISKTNFELLATLLSEQNQ